MFKDKQVNIPMLQVTLGLHVNDFKYFGFSVHQPSRVHSSGVLYNS